ncbi:MAG: dTDP-4-dehydrorhamnose reductase [Demequinaceae bacterium]|nr:dTDP-4-dehydrorhamnose reductase [Demequinaceae bacterium]
MLGTDLIAMLRKRGAVVAVSDQDTLDITDPLAVKEGLAGARVVVNCAAFTAVDAAEEREAEALVVNGDGAGVLARECAATGARLVHISTDYVFFGDATEPYAEDSPHHPVNAYGRTKAAGEVAVLDSGADVLIVRTSWLYGAHGACFPKTIARVAQDRGSVEVVDDQVGQPTWAADLADLILRLIEADAPSGVYHGTASGQTSWYGFAREITAWAGLGDIVIPCDSSAFPRPAARPSYSVLSHASLERIGIAPIGPWLERWHTAAPSILKKASS